METKDKINELLSTGASVICNVEEKWNKYEFGPANSRFTLHFQTLEDLQRQIAELKDAVLVLA
jgi:hypothetical protein